MDWWATFFKVRRTVFVFISITSLLWAIVLSVYIAREWKDVIWAQRALVLAIIGANGLTAIMMYLMAVVVFRAWLDLTRVVFLLLLHIGSALMFTLFGSNFSCDTFKTKAICKRVDLAFVIGSWVMTGLLLGYIPYLLIMIRVPRPTPQITPNPLLHTPPMSRRSSVASVNSTTRLIRQDSTESFYTTPTSFRTSSARRVARYSSYAGFIPNRQASPPVRTGGPYGTKDSPRSPSSSNLPFRSVSVTPPTPNGSNYTPASLQTAEAMARNSSRSSPRPLPEPPVFFNPFADPVSRQTTPQSAYSQMSFNTITKPPSHAGPHSYLEQWPPLLPLPTAAASTRSSTSTLLPTVATMVPVWSSYERRWVYSSNDRPMSGQPNMVTTGSTLRAHTTTPHSIHSVAPSMHLHPSMTHGPPSPVHTRAHSDPFPYRPSTAAPTQATRIDPDAPLPNPFGPLVGTSEVRRFGSVPSAQFYTGQGGTYARNTRNAAHLAGALGRTPPRAEAAVADREQWRQLGYTAATGRQV
ncbi:hypothetical protein BDW22DRAFT_1420872 [Trametopsis cervina]|nr:hypothetical protein BDW22DRAFT_1420872 [Trametopsis cervina]